MSELTDRIKKDIERKKDVLRLDKIALVSLLIEEAEIKGFKEGIIVKPKNSEQEYKFQRFTRLGNSNDLYCEGWHDNGSVRSPYLVTLSVDNLEIVK